jgi:hypothetical protein
MLLARTGARTGHTGLGNQLALSLSALASFAATGLSTVVMVSRST